MALITPLFLSTIFLTFAGIVSAGVFAFRR